MTINSFIAKDSLDSLDHSDLRVKKGQLIFSDYYWSWIFRIPINQKFNIEKLSNDTLILRTQDSTHRALFSIFEIVHQDRIIFRKSENMCILKKGEARKP